MCSFSLPSPHLVDLGSGKVAGVSNTIIFCFSKEFLLFIGFLTFHIGITLSQDLIGPQYNPSGVLTH